MEDLMTNAVHAETALLPEGWVANVRLTLEGGRIASVENGVAPGIADERHAVLVPALPNLHSPAFQRAMAGLAETRGPGSDNFWSWRDLRSAEHTSELQSLMRTSYAVFRL